MSGFKLNLNWLRQIFLILFSGLVIFYHMIPFTLTPTTLPAPDILFCVICALIIRRPNTVPFGIVAIIYFGFDLFQMKPLGVWTTCMLVASEIWRANRDIFRENMFPIEWLAVSGLFLFSLIANRVILAIALVPAPKLSSMVWEFLFTVLAYPIILFILTYVLRIRKPALGEFGLKGQKL